MGQGGTLTSDTQTFSHRVDTHPSLLTLRTAPWTPATLAIFLETRRQSHQALQRESSLAEAALHTGILTHSSHLLTAELSPNMQTSWSTDTLGPSTPDTLGLDYIHTQTDTPTHKGPDYTQGWGHTPALCPRRAVQRQSGGIPRQILTPGIAGLGCWLPLPVCPRWGGA